MFNCICNKKKVKRGDSDTLGVEKERTKKWEGKDVTRHQQSNKNVLKAVGLAEQQPTEVNTRMHYNHKALVTVLLLPGCP